MDVIEKTLHMVKEYIPTPGTKLGEFVFLSEDTLWTGEMEEGSFVAVAEDRWPLNGGGYVLAVLTEGPVYVAELDSNNLLNYCASGFPQFMEILKLYQEILETTPFPDDMDNEDSEEWAEREQDFRQQVKKIDSTAIADGEGFWSTLIEEVGAGMW